MRPVYPWSAIVGQDAMKQALLLCAIDPAIGGVLIHGPRGVAKTTLARALSELVPGPFVELPLGATEERITGSLDLDAALREGRVGFSPGLLARAHDGVLYVDEVNLLPDALVDVLLDAAATGRNVVERDGVSHEHPARFVLVGSMNPEEGELRPQLIDRFGLSVEADAELTPATRVRIVQQRLDYERDPESHAASYREEQARLVERCRLARRHLARLPWDAASAEQVAERCHAAGVEGVRADLAMLRAARAHAAWHARAAVTDADIEAVSEAALAHRRADPPPERPSPGDPTGSPRPNGSRPESRSDAGTRPPAPPETPPTRAAAPVSETPPGSSTRPQENAAGSDAAPRGGAVPAVPVATERHVGPLRPPWIRPSRGGRAEPRRKGRALLPGGRRAHAPALAARGSVDWFATLARGQRPRHRADLEWRARASPRRELWVLAVDCSGSMLRGGALSRAKGLARALELEARRRGARTALIAFRDRSARLEVEPEGAPGRVLRSLDGMGGGGGTPLRRALLEVTRLSREARWQAPDVSKRLVLLTDGRSREALHDLRVELDRLGVDRTVIDCERRFVRLGRSGELARRLGARCVHADALTARRAASR